MKNEQDKVGIRNERAVLKVSGEGMERVVSGGKMTIRRDVQFVDEEVIQRHGGIVMTWDYELGQFSKRLIMIDHEFGDEDYHIAKFSSFYT